LRMCCNQSTCDPGKCCDKGKQPGNCTPEDIKICHGPNGPHSGKHPC